MGCKALRFGKCFNIVVEWLQRFSGIVNNAGFLDIVIHAERGEEPGGAICGKDMVRSGKIIA